MSNRIAGYQKRRLRTEYMPSVSGRLSSESRAWILPRMETAGPHFTTAIEPAEKWLNVCFYCAYIAAKFLDLPRDKYARLSFRCDVLSCQPEVQKGTAAFDSKLNRVRVAGDFHTVEILWELFAWIVCFDGCGRTCMNLWDQIKTKLASTLSEESFQNWVAGTMQLQ